MELLYHCFLPECACESLIKSGFFVYVLGQCVDCNVNVVVVVPESNSNLNLEDFCFDNGYEYHLLSSYYDYYDESLPF